MSRFRKLVGAVVLALAVPVGAADEFTVEGLKEAPEGLSPEIAKLFGPGGYRVLGKDGHVCDVWLRADVPLKPKFKPTDVIKYPFLSGELMGAIRFPDKPEGGDFRGQAVPPGVYTLRYGQQPMDGNHLGTSDVRDFLLCCPPQEDKTAKRIEKITDLFKLSAKAVKTTHPAVFQLQPPPDQPHAAVGAEHDGEKHLLVLRLNVDAAGEGKKVQVPLRIVVIGKSEG